MLSLNCKIEGEYNKYNWNYKYFSSQQFSRIYRLNHRIDIKVNSFHTILCSLNFYPSIVSKSDYIQPNKRSFCWIGYE